MFDLTISLTVKQEENQSALFIKRVMSDVDTPYTNGYTINPYNGTARNLYRLWAESVLGGSDDSKNTPSTTTTPATTTPSPSGQSTTSGVAIPRFPGIEPLDFTNYHNHSIDNNPTRQQQLTSLTQYRYPMITAPDWTNLHSRLGFPTALTPQQQLQRQYAGAIHELHRHAAMGLIMKQIDNNNNIHSNPQKVSIQPSGESCGQRDPRWRKQGLDVTPETPQNHYPTLPMRDVIPPTHTIPTPTPSQLESLWPPLPSKPTDTTTLPVPMHTAYSNPVFAATPYIYHYDDNGAEIRPVPPTPIKPIYLNPTLYQTTVVEVVDDESEKNINSNTNTNTNNASTNTTPLPPPPPPSQSLLGFQRGNNFTNVHWLLRRFCHNDFRLPPPFNPWAHSNTNYRYLSFFPQENVLHKDRFDLSFSQSVHHDIQPSALSKIIPYQTLSIFDLMVHHTWDKALYVVDPQSQSYPYLPTYPQNIFNTVPPPGPKSRWDENVSKYLSMNGSEYLYQSDVWVHFFATLLLSFRLFIFHDQLHQLDGKNGTNITSTGPRRLALNYPSSRPSANKKRDQALQTPIQLPAALTHSLDQYLNTMVYAPGQLETFKMKFSHEQKQEQMEPSSLPPSSTTSYLKPTSIQPYLHHPDHFFDDKSSPDTTTVITNKGKVSKLDPHSIQLQPYWTKLVSTLAKLTTQSTPITTAPTEADIWSTLAHDYLVQTTLCRLIVPDKAAWDAIRISKAPHIHCIQQVTGGALGSPPVDLVQRGMCQIAGYMYFTFAKDAVALATLWFGEYIEAFDCYQAKKR